MTALLIDSETNHLRAVVIGYPDNFHAVPPESVNETQRRFYFGSEHPDRQTIIREYASFRECLQQRGVVVRQPMAVPGVPDQLSPRDIGFVIGDTLVLANMVWRSRKDEWNGLKDLLEQVPASKTIRPPEEARIEGGDVIVDRGRIYVGIGQRTTFAGAQFLVEKFPHFEVVPIELTTLSEGEDVVHLDCVFAPVGEQSALIYRAGFKTLPDSISGQYDLIDVTSTEQRQLATNVLSVSPNEVISMPTMTRMNEELERRGIEVLKVDFSETIKTGGSFHCGSLPLARYAG